MFFLFFSGKKFLIGDNLSAHVSLEAIELCSLHDIHFIFLPSNSTHLLQPLDVAVFSSLKSNWREILTEWKQKEGQNEVTLPKFKFPTLLKRLMTRIDGTVKNNVVNGFRKCGIIPLDPQPVLARLPPMPIDLNESQNAVENSFASFLSALRPDGNNVRKTKKSLKVAPGKSVSVQDLTVLQDKTNVPSTSGEPFSRQPPKQPKRIQQRRESTRTMPSRGCKSDRVFVLDDGSVLESSDSE